MATSAWSVRLAVDEGEAGPISGALQFALTSETHRLSVSRPSSPFDEGSDVVTFELDAEDADHARVLAQHLLGKARKAAALKQQEARVVWVAPMLPALTRSSNRFLEQARSLLDDEEALDLAVVAAQIHLEIQVKILIERAVADDPSRLKGAIVDQRHTWAPQDRLVSAILEALFGVRVTEYPRWEDYRAHLTRRNDVAHRGQEVDRAAAEESIAVIEGFWLWLNDLAKTAGRST